MAKPCFCFRGAFVSEGSTLSRGVFVFKPEDSDALIFRVPEFNSCGEEQEKNPWTGKCNESMQAEDRKSVV